MLAFPSGPVTLGNMPDATSTDALMTGRWPFDGYPKEVRMRGRVFARFDWATTHYDGVVARYHERGVRKGAHMSVLDDGSYKLDPISGMPASVVPVAARAPETEQRSGWTRLALGAVGVILGFGLLAVLGTGNKTR